MLSTSRALYNPRGYTLGLSILKRQFVTFTHNKQTSNIPPLRERRINYNSTPQLISQQQQQQQHNARRNVSFNLGNNNNNKNNTDTSKFRFSNDINNNTSKVKLATDTQPPKSRADAVLGSKPISPSSTFNNNNTQKNISMSKTTFRQMWVNIREFFWDIDAPYTKATDNRLIKIFKWLSRRALYPYRRIAKFISRINISLGSKGSWVRPFILILIAMTVGTLYGAIQLIYRATLRTQRELFIRSSLPDLAARLNMYGILDPQETENVLTRLGVIGSSTDEHFNTRGHQLMKSFLQQAVSTPVELANALENMYEPQSRVDEITTGVLNLLLDKLSDLDPNSAAEKVPPHILSIASQFVEDWLRSSRQQMRGEKEKAARRKALEQQNKDSLNHVDVADVLESDAELYKGQIFDLSRKERRKLFWRGILTGIMMETNLVSLENETTFLRVAREYALKGCILRGIPERVKQSNEALKRSSTLAASKSHIITANPMREYSFDGESEIKRIRDELTQLPYSPDHAQVDERFINFIFGQKFAKDYGIDSDLFPYLHQIAPLVLLDLATWTHPETLFDLTHEHSPRSFNINQLSVPPAEFEKLEMFNFMMDQFVAKDRVFAFRDRQYKNTSVSKDEGIVLPLLQPHDSILTPKKFGLPEYQSQIEMLDGNVPSCYKDTYGSYAREIFLFDCLILRNYIEVHRLKNTLQTLGTKEVKDVQIPLLYNYYGSFDHVLGPSTIDIFRNESATVERYRKKGLRYRTKHLPGSYSEDQQLEAQPVTQADVDREIMQRTIDKRLAKGGKGKDGSVDDEFHAVTVDDELYKQLNLKGGAPLDLNPVSVTEFDLQGKRRQRAQRWVDNDSV